MQELKRKMIRLLKTYPINAKKLALLRNELSSFTQVTPEEMLEAMVFAKGEEGARPAVGHVSDKTAHIAMSYRQKASEVNESILNEISAQIWGLERRQSRLETCLTQLPAEQADVIRGLYFEGQHPRDLAESLHLSERTILRYRDRAIAELIEMYLALQDAGVILDW